jgi:hypothetical protein
MGKHALLSPSTMERRLICPGSAGLEKDQPDNPSPAAQEGTNYHLLAQICFEQEKDALEFVGMPFEDESEVTEENAEYVQTYLDLVRAEAALGGTVVIEDTVPIAQITGEKDAEGTADCIIIRDEEVVVIDLKFGRGVAVKAEGNKQTRMYAAGAIEKHGLWDVVKRVKMIICQPRVMDGVSEETIDIHELKLFKEEVSVTCRTILRALETGTQLPLHPNEKACKFCKAAKAGICTALTNMVENAATEGFEDLDTPKIIQTSKGPVEVPKADRLGDMMKIADLAEIFIKGVRSAVESSLLAGKPVTGYKLVEGRQGPRKWADEAAIEAQLKKFRVKHEEMYKYKLVSPTAAEKAWKNEKPTWWKKLSEDGNIKRSPAEPSVTTADDPRPEYVVTPPESGFEETFEDLL